MKKTFVLLTALVLSPLFASAQQGSVSYACGTSTMKQFNLEGVTFTAETLAKQGYNISVINGVVDLNKGKETTVVGTLKPRGGCSHTSGLDTAFIDFNNKNLAIGTDVDELGECEAITTDGFYGIHVLTTITLFSIDNHYKTSLSLEYTQGYSSLGQCQAEHPKK